MASREKSSSREVGELEEKRLKVSGRGVDAAHGRDGAISGRGADSGRSMSNISASWNCLVSGS